VIPSKTTETYFDIVLIIEIQKRENKNNKRIPIVSKFFATFEVQLGTGTL
jgi:hypothetical protein